jgi:hypothetical protein
MLMFGPSITSAFMFASTLLLPTFLIPWRGRPAHERTSQARRS